MTVGKADLGKGYWNPKRKLGGNHAFLEIIKQQLFSKVVKYKEMCGVSFQIEAFLALKNAWLPLIFYLDTKSTCKVLFSTHSLKQCKNIPELVGTTHRKPKYQDAQ